MHERGSEARCPIKAERDRIGWKISRILANDASPGQELVLSPHALAAHADPDAGNSWARVKGNPVSDSGRWGETDSELGKDWERNDELSSSPRTVLMACNIRQSQAREDDPLFLPGWCVDFIENGGTIPSSPLFSGPKQEPVGRPNSPSQRVGIAGYALGVWRGGEGGIFVVSQRT